MNKLQQIAIVFCITCLGFSSAYAATNVFLKVSDVEGEATDPEHSNEIDVLSWSWGIENNSKASDRSAANRATPNNGASEMSIVIEKYIDKATTPLMLKCATGKHSKEAVLTVRKADATGEPLHYMIIKMKDVQVTSYSVSADGGERPTEDITFNFTKVDVVYPPQQREDGTTSPAVDFKWSLQSSAKQ